MTGARKRRVTGVAGAAAAGAPPVLLMSCHTHVVDRYSQSRQVSDASAVRVRLSEPVAHAVPRSSVHDRTLS